MKYRHNNIITDIISILTWFNSMFNKSFNRYYNHGLTSKQSVIRKKNFVMLLYWLCACVFCVVFHFCLRNFLLKWLFQYIISLLSPLCIYVKHYFEIDLWIKFCSFNFLCSMFSSWRLNLKFGWICYCFNAEICSDFTPGIKLVESVFPWRMMSNY